MYHLRLCKSLSYSGVVAATAKAPDIFIQDEAAANAAIATGYFKLVAIEGDGEGNGQPGTGAGKALDDMTVPELKEFAEQNTIDLKGLTKRDDILARIKEAQADDQTGNGGDGGASA